MDIIKDFLQEFGNIIFDEHLTLIRAFKNEYENFDSAMICSHDNSSGDVVDTCGCYFFYLKKERVMKIIESYKALIQHFSSKSVTKKKEM